MKFKTRLHFLNIAVHSLIILVCLAIIIFVVLSYSGTGILNVLFMALVGFVTALLIYNSFMPLIKTYYLIDGDENKKILHVHFGKTITDIPLNKIMSIKKVKKLFTLNTMSINKLQIVYVDNNVRNIIHVSPKQEDEFIKQLKIYAKSMKIEPSER